jgi:hypothetical protein
MFSGVFEDGTQSHGIVSNGRCCKRREKKRQYNAEQLNLHATIVFGQKGESESHAGKFFILI